jgi:hypothetical protein
VERARAAWKSSVNDFDGIDRNINSQTRCCFLTRAAAQEQDDEKHSGYAAHSSSLNWVVQIRMADVIASLIMVDLGQKQPLPGFARVVGSAGHAWEIKSEKRVVSAAIRLPQLGQFIVEGLFKRRCSIKSALTRRGEAAGWDMPRRTGVRRVITN